MYLPNEELVVRWHCQTKVECTNDDAFHAEDLTPRVCLVSDVDEIADLGG